MRLLFEGGPWADRVLESEVTTPPDFVAPDDQQVGVYERVADTRSSAVLYEWLPDGTDAVRRRAPADRRDLRRLGDRAGTIAAMMVGFVSEVVGAVVALGLAIVTLVSRDWIEVVFGVHPDQSSGGTEWAVVFALLAISICLALAARRQWRRLKLAA